MEIGRLRDRLLVEHRHTRRNPDGSLDEEWDPAGSCWGQVTPLAGREYWAAQQVASEVTHRVRVRWDPELTSKHRFLKAGPNGFRVFNISAPPRDLGERHRTFEALCVEVKDGA